MGDTCGIFKLNAFLITSQLNQGHPTTECFQIRQKSAGDYQITDSCNKVIITNIATVQTPPIY